MEYDVLTYIARVFPSLNNVTISIPKTFSYVFYNTSLEPHRHFSLYFVSKVHLVLVKEEKNEFY